MSTFYKLSVKEIQQETKDSISIIFNIPLELQEKFKFIPGQYITIKKTLEGNEVRRAYSICSSLQSNIIKVGVKAAENGYFSKYAVKELKVGDVLEVSRPEGRFDLMPNSKHKKNYAAFAAGSGITPILSMIKSVLETETESQFILIYGNKSIADVMFKSEIDDLANRYPTHFSVQYVYSQYEEEGTLFGRIDTAVLNFILNNKFKNLKFDDYFLCGPEPMINLIKENLLEKGVEEKNIHFELFSTNVDDKIGDANIEGRTTVNVLLDDEEHTFEMDRGKTILEVALKNGLDAPYSCQGGICSTCLAQITEGNAVMDKNSILTDDEIEDGLILTCQAHPTTPTINIDYDDV
ncbi:2Fe-2S iron-sulfur cluster-binding protein [Aureibaculum sp. 2210JD6-5]|uniref:2Fe-2S iron-sulfur cluster-binding protein n=1 Tax=Aureibaculum sp. 2210JD6-5 TaxID=3103957 RepID=UPI002AACA90A|nr:2Fe-2S iron-sulfur cluster-binding protein [Aureibaculum sp. 2210JD6-5]MDY7394915.1 2Fe-2S iron-sulfur cluster-binding protein [Aureibaculum sp. 2210JD6-5]